MYLKRLELHGFKTFAPRTTLDFERGVTAVVGPNGSGKSNLADAVRWALGEQNVRHVRCRHAEDLIFAGTAAQGAHARTGTRPPMGMAEVLLTFDNSEGWLPVDFQEVRIGRRAYRGGENEYLLNGVRVRLRDITDLLARASISTSGHLIIGQGLVDTVLALRPEERRGLVENLAGLRFYYSRRDDAEARLRATEVNVRNVDAMIAEAAPHLAALREQADAYARYHEVEQELRGLLLQHYAHAYAQAMERRERAAAELDAAQAALGGATAAVREAEQELAAVRERGHSLTQQAGTLRGEVRAAHGARETAERELAVSRTRREAALARLNELRAGMAPLEARRAEAAKELAHADEGMRAIEGERARLQEMQADHERAVGAATQAATAAERDVRAIAERRRGLEKEEAVAMVELAALGRDEEAAAADDQRLAADEQAAAQGLHEAAAALAGARAALERSVEQADAARAAEAAARTAASDAAGQAQAAAVARRDAARQAEEAQARVAGLRAWLATVAGAAEGGSAGSTRPVAAAMIVAPAAERALAAALGPLLTAQQALPGLTFAAATALLGAGARGVLVAGRARLDRATQQEVQRQLTAAGLEHDALAGWGDALAQVEGAGTSAVALRDALSTVLVVRDLAAAWQAHTILAQLAEPAGCSLVLATLAGEALLPSGLLHRPAEDGAAGGAAALQRTRELRAAERRVQEVQEALQQAEQAAYMAEEESRQQSAAAEERRAALRVAEHEREGRRGEVMTAERAVAQTHREAEWATERRRRAEAAAATRRQRHNEWERRLAEARQGIEALAREEGPAATRHEEARAALEDATRRRAEHGAAAALTVERARDATQRRRTADVALARLDDDLRTRRRALARLESEVHDLRTATEGLAARVVEVGDGLRSLHERLRPLDAELTALEERSRNLEAQVATLRPRQAQAAAVHEAAALNRQRAEHEIESVTAGLQADLAREPADLPPPAPPPPGLPGRVKALRGQLAAFGPVNARAPEDYVAAAERQEFLQTQAHDLREGMARLRSLIAEANATVRERFGTVAAELDTQFRLYLQRLFGGGRGALTALYDEAGLPSGLEIAVQPPGKRTSELALLSGGERALVGLALVFAMLAVRPVPFCVLDEAEAALDEANTLRVGEILRALSARTQFIVITHNRGTMSHADALYGVTMSETGISQVAGLRLEDVEAVRQTRAG